MEPVGDRWASEDQKVICLIQRVTQQFLCAGETRLRKINSFCLGSGSASLGWKVGSALLFYK